MGKRTREWITKNAKAAGKGVFNISVRDAFSSRIEENVIDRTEFYLYTFRQRGRFITLGFSYGFGKGDAMTYSGRRH